MNTFINFMFSVLKLYVLCSKKKGQKLCLGHIIMFIKVVKSYAFGVELGNGKDPEYSSSKKKINMKKDITLTFLPW